MFEFLGQRKLKRPKGEPSAEVQNLQIDDIELDDFEPETLSVADVEAEVEEVGAVENEIENLMSSIKQQSVEISCEFAAFANWSSQIETLSARAATLQPLLKGLVEKTNTQSGEIHELVRRKDEALRQAVELKSELEHYRPLAARFEEELRIVKDKYSQSQSMLASLETQFGQGQAYCNELMHKIAASDSKALRLSEENSALKQKALEHNTTIQNLLREVANLNSAVSIASSDVERQEQELASMAEKLALERAANSQASANLTMVNMREARMEKDLRARLNDLEDQQQVLIQTLAMRDKQLRESEIKYSAVASKVEFLTQLNHRLREDLRGHVNHSNLIEGNNRELLETLSSRTLNEEEFDDAKVGKSPKPRLRAVQVAE